MADLKEEKKIDQTSFFLSLATGATSSTFFFIQLLMAIRWITGDTAAAPSLLFLIPGLISGLLFALSIITGVHAAIIRARE